MNIARHVNNILAKFGIGLVRLSALENVHDVRDCGNCPYSLLYYVSNLDSVLTTLPLSHARDPFFFPLIPNGSHPYVVAAREGLGSNNRRQSIYDVLKRYYEGAQPSTSAEYLGIRFAEGSDLAAAPPRVFVWPWEARTPQQKMEFELGSSYEGARKNNRNDDMQRLQRWKFAGPNGADLINNESLRIEQLLDSLLTHGYKRNKRKDGDIVGVALEADDGKWCWSISSGLHRAAVLSALGFENVPVRIRAIVRLKDVNIWPNVLNGLYSPEEAKQVFLNLYNGQPSPALKNWAAYNDSCQPFATPPPVSPSLT